MTQEFDSIVDSAREAFARAQTPAELENAKAQYVGKSGRITELMKGWPRSPWRRRNARRGHQPGQAGDRSALNQRRQALADAELEAQLKAEALDVSLPGRIREPGGLHPVSLTMERIEQIFASMGFDVADGPRSKATGTASPR